MSGSRELCFLVQESPGGKFGVEVADERYADGTTGCVEVDAFYCCCVDGDEVEHVHLEVWRILDVLLLKRVMFRVREGELTYTPLFRLTLSFEIRPLSHHL